MDLLRAREILELDINYTENDLKQNYRRLVMKYHPDKCKQGGSEKFILIQQAYEYISGNPSDNIDLFKTINDLFKTIVPELKRRKTKVSVNPLEYFSGIKKTNCKCNKDICINCAGCGYNIVEKLQSFKKPLNVCMECLGDGYICNCSKQLNDPNYFFENEKIHYNFKISLKESLIGFEKIFKDPFGKEHLIVIKQPIQSGDGYSLKIKDIELILVFCVIYPKKLPVSLKKILSEIDF